MGVRPYASPAGASSPQTRPLAPQRAGRLTRGADVVVGTCWPATRTSGRPRVQSPAAASHTNLPIAERSVSLLSDRPRETLRHVSPVTLVQCPQQSVSTLACSPPMSKIRPPSCSTRETGETPLSSNCRPRPRRAPAVRGAQQRSGRAVHVDEAAAGRLSALGRRVDADALVVHTKMSGGA